MQPINAVALLTIVYRKAAGAAALPTADIDFGTFTWFTYAGISCFLVIFAGICSGLTLALMPLSQVELEVLRRSGSPSEKKQAAAIIPVVQKQHQLLVTLLLCNAVAMEALPLYLDKMFNPFVAIIMSVTFVLIFGEVIPQAICARYGLAVGANFICVVQVMLVICYPICYPIGKLLDWTLGHSEPLFRRDQLKAFVSIHGEEAGKGGELTHDETTIISGALDLTKKIAEEAMTPIESTFSLDVNSNLDWEAVGKIITSGHSRIPVYHGSPRNIIGVLLVKSLLTVRPETATPVSDVSIRRIPCVPADMPLYDILNEFQKGSSHMAAVMRAKGSRTRPSFCEARGENSSTESSLTTPLLSNRAEKPESIAIDIYPDPMPPLKSKTSELEDGEVVGIITLEDVFEELLQEEIVDETDEFVDVHRRIRVMAAAAASSLVQSPSFRRLAMQKGVYKPGSTPRKSAELGSPAASFLRSFGDTLSANMR
ncbi:DUF21 domain-containing protein At4g14240-like [Salvia miltiorrhiza]|uniref:DUF21 domain-containing protein At4g14240-like n=1 Tax=Salvia miltiorrhiza TaxID=226208 RepID=UPI0025AC2CA5|nr:DUF21 domain-containing protein At4g14240-like [Salvia miltiorrhiza]